MVELLVFNVFTMSVPKFCISQHESSRMNQKSLFIHHLLKLCVNTCVYFPWGEGCSPYETFIGDGLSYFFCIKCVILFVGGHLALFYGK